MRIAPPPFFPVATYARVRNSIESDLRQHREDSDKYNRDDQQAHISVADVSQFVGDDCFQFFVVQLLNNPFRESDRIGAVVDTAGKSVQ